MVLSDGLVYFLKIEIFFSCGFNALKLLHREERLRRGASVDRTACARCMAATSSSVVSHPAPIPTGNFK